VYKKGLGRLGRGAEVGGREMRGTGDGGRGALDEGLETGEGGRLKMKWTDGGGGGDMGRGWGGRWFYLATAKTANTEDTQ
jgi:hypothetical protein